MSGPTHMLTGLYITSIIPNPAISLPTAFASHFVLDMIPHNDYFYFYVGKWKLIFTSPLARATVLIGFALAAFFALRGANPLLLFIGALLGSAPDSITALTEILGYKGNIFNKFHRLIHTNVDLGEVFFNLKGGNIVHNEEMPEWRENFLKMRNSFVANLGWLLEVLLELLFLSVIIYNLLSPK